MILSKMSQLLSFGQSIFHCSCTRDHLQILLLIKVSENPKKWKFKKNSFAGSRCFYSNRMKRKWVFLTKHYFWMKLKANAVCLHFSPKPSLKKKSIKIRSSLTWRQSKKWENMCNLEFLKLKCPCSCLWEAAIQEYF